MARPCHPARLAWIVVCAALLIAALPPLAAQVYELDDAFAPAFWTEDVTPTFFERTDGALWVTGVEFVDGAPVEGIVRFRADGSLDTPISIPFPASKDLEMLEMDGATFVLQAGHIIRLRADGTVDPGFQPPTIWTSRTGKLFPSFDGGVLMPVAALRRADGTVVNFRAFARLRADGSLDDTFPDLEFRIQGVDGAGRLYTLNGRRVQRWLPTGLTDPAWTEVELASTVVQFHVHPDGGGLAHRSSVIERLDPTGNLDPTFAVPLDGFGWSPSYETRAKYLADGRILLLSGSSGTTGDESTTYVVRLHDDGRVDETFAPPAGIGAGVGFWGERPLVRFRDPDARPRFAGRLLANGQLDPAWLPGFGRRGSLSDIRTDLEGRILVAGYFDFVDGGARHGIVRFLPDGTLDDSFVPPATAPRGYYASANGYDHIRVGRDGSVLLNTLIFFSPSSPHREVMTRLTASGAPHADQLPSIAEPHDASAGEDGTLYFTQAISTPLPGTGTGTTSFRLIRRAPGSTSDEMLPVEFRELIVGPSPYSAYLIRGSDFEVLEDGRILVVEGLKSAPQTSAIVAADGSQATSLPATVPARQSGFPLYAPQTLYPNGVARLTIQRITSDGSLDTEFVPPAITDHLDFLGADGRGGAVAWRWIDSRETGTTVRLRGDGSLDPGWSHPGTSVIGAAAAADRSVFVLSDGKLQRLALEVRETVAAELITPNPVAGRTTILAAGVGVPGDVTWRWQRDGVDVPGATGPSLTLQPARLSDSGTYQAFATVDGLTLESGPITLAVQAPMARLVNLSARTRVIAEESQQIAGFVLAHPASVVVRGVGPSLASWGIQQPLRAPELILRDAEADELARNAGWDGAGELQAAFGRVGAFLLPADSDDAALVASLPAGLYSAAISGSPAGISLAELYLDSTDNNAPFLNLSIRASVGSGEATVIAGFVVEGNGPQRLLIRAIGRSLLAHGVTTPMDDPSFSIHRGDTVVLTNDDATSEARAAEVETGAFALAPDVGDAAAVAYLEPGLYTVLVSGDSGIVLVEIYALPPF